MATKVYCLADFILCCMYDQQQVQVFYDAELNARQQFGLNKKTDLIEFIGNQGLQDVTYWNTELWRKNPNKNEDIYIDAYKFRSTQKQGYIAFMKGFTCKYVIKSFHLDNEKITLKDIGVNTAKQLKEGL